MTKKTNEPSGWNPVFEFPLDDRNTIIIDGVRYQRIIEPQSFYDKIYGLLKPNLDERVDTGEITTGVLDLIREIIPEPMMCDDEDYDAGWNDAIRKMEGKLK